MRILVLEDDDLVARSLTRSLRHLGHSAVCANTVAAARAAWEVEGPMELMMLDIELGDGDSGLDFLDWARERRLPARKIIMSGGEPRSLRLDPADEHFVRKPITLKSLEQFLADRPT